MSGRARAAARVVWCGLIAGLLAGCGAATDPPADADVAGEVAELGGADADAATAELAEDAVADGEADASQPEIDAAAEVSGPDPRCPDICEKSLALGCGPELADGDTCAEFCLSEASEALPMACLAAAVDCPAVQSCFNPTQPGCDGPCCLESGEAPPPPPEVPTTISGSFTAVEPADPAALAEIPVFEIALDASGTLTAGLFGDLDGDGVQELVVTGDQNGHAVAFSYDAAAGTLVALEGAPFGKGRVVGLEDFDGDGALDALVMRDDTPMMLWNDGAGGFVAEPMLPPGAHVDLAIRSVALGDLDGDGWLDALAEASSCCSLACPDLVPLLRTGPRAWEPRPDRMKTVNHANLTAIMVAPLGPADVVLFGIGGLGCGGPYQAMYQRTTVDAAGWPSFEAVTALTPEADAELVSSAPMGAAVTDADGDGFWDMAVTLDPEHALYAGRPTWPLVDRTKLSGIGTCGRIETPETRAIFEAFVPWGVAWLDLDRDGRDDLVFTHGPDPGANPHGMFEQPVTAHWNDGQLRFGDITAQVGLSAVGNWRGLVVDDLEGDGDPDLYIGGNGRLPWLVRNDVEVAGHGFGLRLRGTTSNHLGIGAVVEVEVAGQPGVQRRVVGAMGNPVALSRPMVFVGLGAATAAEVVRVRWPSGVVQEVLGLAAGAVHTVEEPVSVVVEPASRRLAAGGAERARVRAFARKADGSVDAGATVEIRIAYGSGSFAGPAVPDGGGVAREVVAPAGAGSTVIEVLVGGKPLGVRPRIWWD